MVRTSSWQTKVSYSVGKSRRLRVQIHVVLASTCVARNIEKSAMVSYSVGKK